MTGRTRLVSPLLGPLARAVVPGGKETQPPPRDLQVLPGLHPWCPRPPPPGPGEPVDPQDVPEGLPRAGGKPGGSRDGFQGVFRGAAAGIHGIHRADTALEGGAG